MLKYHKFGLIMLLLVLLSACGDVAEPPVAESVDARATAESVARATAESVAGETAVADTVSLTESTVSWETYQYELTEENGIVPGSYDGVARVERSYPSWILENNYLKVTLVPEMGGRILSLIYKPTGHEELYQNPVGVPYQIGTGVFYYDWLMVYGGIFPTFPEPEHGKTWLMPWEFEVVNESAEAVTVAMSITDDIDYALAPNQYDVGPTGLEVTYFVTLEAGRAAVDTRVVINNPGEESVDYEYWTNTTLAPGSDPADPKTTAGAEIIAPVDMIKIPNFWQGIAAQEEATGLIDVYEFNALRRFENWPDMGITYAFPDMGDQNFWGVINHDNNEGIFRIADNSLTPGLKMWTWGYPASTAVDPMTEASEIRPYIELWAGVTREFWWRTDLPANEQLEIEEIYSPSVGLTNVTHANENFLVNLDVDEAGTFSCQFFGLLPDQTVNISLSLDGETFFSDNQLVNPDNGNDCGAELPEWTADSTVTLLIEDNNDQPLFEGSHVFQ
jgi:hypothetical protein